MKNIGVLGKKFYLVMISTKDSDENFIKTMKNSGFAWVCIYG